MGLNLSAIDLGFLYTKSIVNGKKHIMKSVVGHGKQLRFRDLDMGNKDKDDIIFYAEPDASGKKPTSFVSDLAIDQSDVILHSLQDKRFDSAVTDVLARTALAKGFGHGSFETKVVSGLPVSHYAMYKEDITKMFLGTTKTGKVHPYEVEFDRQRSIKGEVFTDEGKFIPQPFGALLDFLLDDNGNFRDKSIASKTIAVIDPGFGTTDVYVVDGMSPVEKHTFSIKVAMNYAYQIIANRIEEDLGKTIPLYEVEGIVRTGEFRKGGKRLDMKPLIKYAFDATSDKMMSDILNKWKDGIHDIEMILVAGGGGANLFKGIQEHVENVQLLPDPQWAVVNGYYKWGVRTYGKTVLI